MPQTVRIPTPLRSFTANQAVVEVDAATVCELILQLKSRFPGIEERLVDPSGKLLRFVNLYVNEDDIRFLQNQETPLKNRDEISIIPAISGG